MKLVVKFNLVFIVVFSLGFAAAGFVTNDLLQRNAKEEILQNARLIMESALASRGYTAGQVAPLLQTQMKYDFLPQTVPAYGATEQFNTLHAKFPDFSYKEATLNPTNLRDRASDWEADVVNRFRADNAQKEITGERETTTGRSLFMARPIQITNGACLVCHSTVDVAPKTMLDKYGTANGFGWKLNEVIGAQVVSVPMTLPIARADAAFRTFMISLAAIFVAIFIVLNLMLMFIVVNPVRKLAGVADEVSLGKVDTAEFNVKGRDEIAVLAQSFNRMKKSLAQALKMLDE
ncbi:MAG: signal protein [Betaproteobacteria bacterium]|nr:signal protein [Betaproteobacteria bacterium]